MKYNYVYVITNKINHKFYIGKHSTNNLDDGYMGSGITINNAILKYGIENFTKRILCFCDSADDAYKVEEFLVTDNLIKRDDCYNMVVGDRGNFLPDHFGEKILSLVSTTPRNKRKNGAKQEKEKPQVVKIQCLVSTTPRNKRKNGVNHVKVKHNLNFNG